MKLEIGTYVLLKPTDWYPIIGKVIDFTHDEKDAIFEYEIKRYSKYETKTGVFSKGCYELPSEEKLKKYIRDKNLRELL